MASITPYNILSICSGVGGLDLAIQISVENARTICHVEREVQAAAVLAARMADKTIHEAPVWSDLSTFKGKPWNGLVDCIISSDPCQPNSVAGARRGAEDDRFLIDQLVRVVDEVRPSRVFRENVTGNADGQLAALVPNLERMGYSVAAGIFSAAEVGASHRRERLFIMADTKCPERRPRKSPRHVTNGKTGERQKETGGNRASGETLADANGSNAIGRPKKLCRKKEKERSFRFASGSGNVADTMRTEPQGQQSGQHQQARREIKDGFATLQGRARLPYFAPGPNDPRWGEIIRQAPSLKPALRTMADGVVNRVDELRAAGNGVCPMAGAIAWLSLSAHFEEG